MVDVGLEPATQNTHGLSTTPFAKVLVGISPFDHLQKVNQQLTQTKPYNTFIWGGKKPSNRET